MIFTGIPVSAEQTQVGDMALADEHTANEVAPCAIGYLYPCTAMNGQCTGYFRFTCANTYSHAEGTPSARNCPFSAHEDRLQDYIYYNNYCIACEVCHAPMSQQNLTGIAVTHKHYDRHTFHAGIEDLLICSYRY